MKIKFAYLLLLISVFGGCNQHSETEKYYKEYDKVINVHDRLLPIKIEDIFIGEIIQLNLLDNYLIIGDYQSPDKLIHLFDKNNFKYICSTGNKGKGPGEITNLGHIAPDKIHRKLYVSDNGQAKLFCFDVDSLLADPLYLPYVKLNLSKSVVPINYIYVNDTLCIGCCWEIIGNNNFKPYVGKWNMLSNEVKLIKYEHPDVKRKRVSTAVSPKFGLYIEAHGCYDLITIGSLSGELRCNIYGPNWETQLSKKSYYGRCKFCKDKIFVTYLAKDLFTKEANGEIRGNYTTQFIIFDLEGNYLQTLETDYRLKDFIYDEENNRLIMGIEDADVQFAYLNLDGLL